MTRIDDRRVRAIVGRVLCVGLFWWAMLAGLFVLFVGAWDGLDWIGAAVAGLIAAALTAVLDRLRVLLYRGKWGWLALVPSVVLQILVDFGLVTLRLAQLFRSGGGEGVFVAREFPAGNRNVDGPSWRSFVTMAATFSPNSYVIDIDPDTGVRLSHDLVANRASERPA